MHLHAAPGLPLAQRTAVRDQLFPVHPLPVGDLDDVRRVVPVNDRADARRSRASIIDAAVDLLSTDPECRIESIAAAAGVTRQTVYAHFSSREQLLAAVLQRVTENAVAALDAIDLETGSATDALLRLLDVSARNPARHRPLFRMLGDLPAPPDGDRRSHAPVTGRLERLIVRGQRAGEFDSRLSAYWLATAVVQLGHAAGDEVDAGRMGREEAVLALRVTVLRLLVEPVAQAAW
ncbi:TetR/AcrR family transcriptional regulator [Actinoplanes sp. NPDC023801]|uniref:TetR/AcrR family transcriptional regulator n=1 Tax=Actinoplanes sp. NPDC023801 TaxID=3154595 RepID=UPI0033EDAA0B